MIDQNNAPAGYIAVLESKGQPCICCAFDSDKGCTDRSGVECSRYGRPDKCGVIFVKLEHNQCDGCARGLRVVDGLHLDADDHPVIGCTAGLYSTQSAEPVEDEEELREYTYAPYIPDNDEAAEAWLAVLPFIAHLDLLPKSSFLALWCAVMYLNPCCHPDDCDEWPRPIQDVAIEAFRRRNTDMFSEDELYPSGVISCNLGRRARERRFENQKGTI